jgi:pyruvate kinase
MKKAKEKINSIKRKTKIIATLGPASVNSIDRLLKYVDIIRINFAHGDAKARKMYFSLVNKRVPILVDLPGPKLRVGEIKGEIHLKKGEKVRFGKNGIPVDDPIFFDIIKRGINIFIADGKIKVAITDVGKDYAEGIVKEGGILTSKKGINIPDGKIVSGVTNKDLELLKEALKLGATYIGVSFVANKDDILRIRDIVKDKAWIIAKIERKVALKNLEEIVEVVDGIMVARGDLGIEVGLPNLPKAQKIIIRKARKFGKPVILATQVLESMVDSPIPTRAETIDIANSVLEGVDAIMLSDETSIGKYPINAVKVLNDIIIKAEKSFRPKEIQLYKNVDEAMAYSAIITSELSKASLIVTYTRSGSTALRVSRLRPSCTILSLTPSIDVANKLKICYGVYTKKVNELKTIDNIIRTAKKEAKKLNRKGFIVILGGVGKDSKGTTRFLRIEKI